VTTEHSLHRIIVAAFATVLLVAACSTSKPVTEPTATSVLLPPVIPTALPTPERSLVNRNILLPPGPGNPRNSEGDFIELTDGLIMFAYTRFTGGGRDQDAADIAARFSSDDGATWTTEDVTIVANEGLQNVMSVSLLRLDQEIALFYLVKDSLADTRPMMRLSTDEGSTWSEPIEMIPDEQVGYYVLNNDRVIQLASGRLVAPVSQHASADRKWDAHGHIMYYLSDDAGRTWRRSKSVLRPDESGEGRVTFQEPGVVELSPDRLLSFIRTDAGTQYYANSKDGGETWTAPRPSSLRSPLSPASIERIPGTGDLIALWNNNSLDSRRTPFNVAISRNDGQTWESTKILEDDPDGWYCYTAIMFRGNRVLLGHVAGDRDEGKLSTTQITSFDVNWLYD
jgi:hypothetical protein